MECNNEKILLKSKIIENVDTGIIILEGPKIKYANNWVFLKTGYTEDEIYSAESFEIFVSDSHREIIKDYNNRRILGDKSVPTNYELKIINKDKSYLWVDCTVSTVIINDVSKILFFMKDITCFKKTEENYKTIFELSPDAISISKLSTGEIYQANKAFTEITGYKKEELLNHSIYDFLVDIDKNEIINDLLKNGTIIQKKLLMKHKNGNNINVSMSSRHLNVYTDKFVITITRDITQNIEQNKKINETTIKNKALYSSLMILLDNSSYFMWVKDLNNNILFANKPLRKLFGVKEDFVNVNGTNISSLFDLGPECIENNKSVIKSKKEEIFTESFSINNEKHIFKTFKTPVLDKNGDVIGISSMATEIVDTEYINNRLDSFTKHVNEKHKIISNIINSIQIKNKDNKI